MHEREWVSEQEKNLATISLLSYLQKKNKLIALSAARCCLMVAHSLKRYFYFSSTGNCVQKKREREQGSERARRKDNQIESRELWAAMELIWIRCVFWMHHTLSLISSQMIAKKSPLYMQSMWST